MASSIRQKFLSGENTNYVLQEIIKPLNAAGVEVNIRDLQQKIFNFMTEVCNRYPNSNSIPQLNDFVIKKSVEKYTKNNQTGTNMPSRRGTAEATTSLFERELMERQYKMQQGPGGNQQQGSNPSGSMSLSHAITGEEDQPRQQDRNGPPPPTSTRITDRTKDYDESDQQQQQAQEQQYPVSYSRSQQQQQGGEILLSLSKDDLVNVDGDMYTFCWNHKILSNFGDNFSIEMRYVTLPKNLSHILVNYVPEDQSAPNNNNKSSTANNGKSRVYSATGKNYSAKLIPCHTSEEHTTYQAVQSGQQGGGETQGQLPSTLTFQMIAPMSQKLDLSVIPVQKIVKMDKTIQVMTKVPHNLGEDDQLTLEFSQQQVCYRITNLEIQSDRQISFNSPFSGYFSSDFRLIRNNWNIDLTLVCKYRTKI